MPKNNLLQIELWLDCKNKCDFCCLGEYTHPTTVDYKTQTIKKAIEYFHLIDWQKYNEFAIIGGELFATKFTDSLKNIFNIFLNEIVLQIKKGNIKKFYIMTSLIFTNDYFFEILNLFKKENIQDYIMINTSFDTKYRFNDNKKKIFYNNIKSIKESNFPIHFEIILSDFFLDSYINKDSELYEILDNYIVDLLRPTVPWKGSKNNTPIDFFPKREKFLKFLPLLKKQHPHIHEKLLSMDTRAENIYTTINNKTIERDKENYIDAKDHILSECGHDSLYKCYSNSDKCIVCDIKKFNEIKC